jgi:hypothetical protein
LAPLKGHQNFLFLFSCLLLNFDAFGSCCVKFAAFLTKTVEGLTNKM